MAAILDAAGRCSSAAGAGVIRSGMTSSAAPPDCVSVAIHILLPPELK
jgi:hypothetical protein